MLNSYRILPFPEALLLPKGVGGFMPGGYRSAIVVSVGDKVVFCSAV